MTSSSEKCCEESGSGVIGQGLRESADKGGTVGEGLWDEPAQRRCKCDERACGGWASQGEEMGGGRQEVVDPIQGTARSPVGLEWRSEGEAGAVRMEWGPGHSLGAL